MDKPDCRELQRFFEREFPQATTRVERVGGRSATLRQAISEDHLRPGRTVSGPTMMALADSATYLAILSEIGLVALAVTTNLSISFLRKPSEDADLLATATLLKLGSRLAVAEVQIISEGDDEPVAHATVTYSIPPGARLLRDSPLAEIT